MIQDETGSSNSLKNNRMVIQVGVPFTRDLENQSRPFTLNAVSVPIRSIRQIGVQNC